MSTVDAPAPTKRCSKCAEVKPLAAFNRRADRPDGRRSECRDCERAAKRERRRERVDAGLCRDCGEPAAPGRSHCAEHLAAARARTRATQQARRAEGRCQWFGCPHMAAPGRTLCADHLAALRERAAARVAEGRCRQVGCPNDAEPGRTYCADHLAAKAARHRARADAGLCWCGEPAAPGRRRCSEHLAANRAHHRARIADGRQAAALRAWRERNREAGWCYNGGRSHGPATHGVLCANCAARNVAKYRRVMTEFTAILADQGVDHDGRCELCGLAEATQVDHVLPRTLGGIDDDPLLLRWVCATCNASRGNNTAWVPPLTAWDVEEQLSREEDR